MIKPEKFDESEDWWETVGETPKQKTSDMADSGVGYYLYHIANEDTDVNSGTLIDVMQGTQKPVLKKLGPYFVKTFECHEPKPDTKYEAVCDNGHWAYSDDMAQVESAKMVVHTELDLDKMDGLT